MRTNVPTRAKVGFGSREHPLSSTELQVPLLLSGLIASLYYVAINIAAYVLWMAVLAITLLRKAPEWT